MGNFEVVKKEPAQLVSLAKIIWFGKFKNKSIKTIIKDEVCGFNYIRWMIDSDIIELDVEGEELLQAWEEEAGEEYKFDDVLNEVFLND